MGMFNRCYLWGVEVKYRMGLYTVGVVFLKGIADALTGRFTVDYLTLLEMLLASFAFACIEAVVFPKGRDWQEKGRGARIALWAAAANIIYIGGSLVFGWFAEIPVLWHVVLVSALEMGLGSALYALRLAAERDTAHLNRKLHQFQEEGKNDL